MTTSPRMRLVAPVLIYTIATIITIQATECNLPKSLKKEIKSYKKIANTIIDTFTQGKHKGYVYKQLAKFVDKFGPRPAGSQVLENSIDYMVKLFKQKNLDNVHTESVMVPHWVRGAESATLLSPRHHNLTLLGLGGSISTPKKGLKGDVVVVKSFEELTNVDAKDKIIVFNQKYDNYDNAVVYRTKGAVEAARNGAIAALISSITPFSMNTPHAGWQVYDADVNQIPVAAIAPEDAHMLKRMQDRDEKLQIKLVLLSKMLPEAESRNVVADITGREKPMKVVVVSGHLDSWDVGQGAMDDGGGAFISWIALEILKDLKLRPRKTLRSILWTSEETGMYGGKAYGKQHAEKLNNFEIIMESDEGTFTPTGLNYQGPDAGACILEEVVRLLEPINATKVTRDPVNGVDIANLGSNFGVPLASLLNANDRYFWYHHTAADTMDVLDSDSLDKCAAAWAISAYVIADLSVPFPRGERSRSTF